MFWDQTLHSPLLLESRWFIAFQPYSSHVIILIWFKTLFGATWCILMLPQVPLWISNKSIYENKCFLPSTGNRSQWLHFNNSKQIRNYFPAVRSEFQSKNYRLRLPRSKNLLQTFIMEPFLGCRTLFGLWKKGTYLSLHSWGGQNLTNTLNTKLALIAILLVLCFCEDPELTACSRKCLLLLSEDLV